MKKYYTAFVISAEQGYLKDFGWNRYEKEQDAIDEVLLFNYSVELIVLPIYVPTKLQNK